MTLKDVILDDNEAVFLNLDDFAEIATVVYAGVTYADIPVVLSGYTQEDRSRNVTDHAQGVYTVSHTLHCALADLNGVQPKPGQHLKLCREDQKVLNFHVVRSQPEYGLLRLEMKIME